MLSKVDCEKCGEFMAPGHECKLEAEPAQKPRDEDVAKLVEAANKAVEELEADWFGVTINDVTNRQLNAIGKRLRAAVEAVERGAQ